MSKADAEAPFAAVVERPSTQVVCAHTLQVARFQGWIASGQGGSAQVRVSVGDAEPYAVPAKAPRPDVLEVLGRGTGLKYAFGFSFFVDLPPALAEPLAVVLEASDGFRSFRFPEYLVDPRVDITCLDTYLGDPAQLRYLARTHLRGRGLEFGALHMPVEIDREVATISYADKRTKAESLDLYPEMRVPFGAAMVDVDRVIDLDRADLSELASEGFDFFVASGVLEHLANPLLFLERLGRAMKRGARFLISVPDRDFAFDTFRALTPTEHLVAEYEARITHVSDAHVLDALRHLLPSIPVDPGERTALFAAHRERSIHVHVWDQRSMDEFLGMAIRNLSLGMRVVDRATSREADGNCIYVLEKVA